MKKLGKKGKEWVRSRALIIKRALVEGRVILNENKNLMGKCEDCKLWKSLSLDHIKKRSQGGKHNYENIAFVCFKCHNERDNMGDKNNKKIKNKKPVWSEPHNCSNCKYITRQLICHICQKLSIK